MDWLAWGISWGLSWGASWGDIEVEEHPNRYAAGGLAKPRRGTIRPGLFRPRPARPFHPSQPLLDVDGPRRRDEDALLACGLV